MKRVFLFLCLVVRVCGPLMAQQPLKYVFPESPVSIMYTDDANFCYKLIERQAHYLLTLVKPWHGNESYKLTTASRGRGLEHIVRPNTGAIAIFSFLYRFGPYDETIVGMSREQLLGNVIIPMMRYITAVHKTGDMTLDDKQTWGRNWQSAHWTHQLGQGASSIWKDLPADLQQRILEVIRYEADRIASMNPPYQLYNDSKSEENAWNAGPLSSALLLMPDDDHAPLWEKQLQKWLLSAYLCTNDADSKQIVDGCPLNEQYGGANIFNDYTLQNHGLAHPDYMMSSTLKGETMIDRLASGLPVLDACMFNLNNIYDQLKVLLMPSTGFIYPTGQDWAIYRQADWPNMHAFCLYYYHDRESLYWLRRGLVMIDRMQQRHSDGRIYGPEENFFPSSQTMAGLGLVDVWKMLMIADPVKEQKPRKIVSRLFKEGKFYVHRTKKAVHSVSWGNKIQFQCLANDEDALVAPEWLNGVGSIRLAKAKMDLPLTVESMQIDTLKSGMRFVFDLQYGDAVSAHMCVCSMNNGKFSVSEKLIALRDMETQKVSTMTIGLLNHPAWIEERGFREVVVEDRTYQFKSQSAAKQQIRGQKIKVDKRMRVETSHPFKGVYVGASAWNRSKLFDKMILNDNCNLQQWKKGDVLNDNAFTIYF